MHLLVIDSATVTLESLQPAVEWLKLGHVVAFPTDTFYGLAVDPVSDTAVRELFDVKGRDPKAALPLVAASAMQVESAFGRFDSTAARLASHFWPGPLSLIVDAPAWVSVAVHGGARTLAVRVPAHPVARALAAAWGRPLTATSANRSGAPSARLVSELVDLASDDRVLVIDGGATPGGAPSTIVDARGSRPILVRDGAIAWNRVLESIHA